MSDRISVTVCAGRSVAISPHPSGLVQLGPLYLRGGDTLQVDREEAERLYQRGEILHPVTGRPKPEPIRHVGPTITYGDGRAIPVSDQAAQLSAAGHAEREGLAEAERQREAQRRNGREPRQMVRSGHPTGSFDPLGPILGMPDGWP